MAQLFDGAAHAVFEAPDGAGAELAYAWCRQRSARHWRCPVRINIGPTRCTVMIHATPVDWWQERTERCFDRRLALKPIGGRSGARASGARVGFPRALRDSPRP
jgi:hypothetical protein